MLAATSLMYSTDTYEIEKQRKAMQTWTDMGFRIISCNAAEEVEKLQGVFPEVFFVELKRSGKELTGKPFPFIYDIVQALKEHAQEDEICAVINSDIFIRNLSAKAVEEYLAANRNTMLILHRYDVEEEEDRSGAYYFSGIDVFCFLSSFLDSFPDRGFMLGRPEWDHWFLHEAVKAGMQVKEVKNKAAFHIKHKQRWSAKDSNRMAKAKTGKEESCKEAYYYETNMILSDLSNRILLVDDRLEENEETVVASLPFYDDADRKKLLEWEREVYGSPVDTESAGVLYFKEQKAYRICALHRRLSSVKEGTVSLGEAFEDEKDKGAILRYVDFKDLDFVKQLGRVYVYPAGRAARLLVDCMDTYGIPVLGMIDRDVSLQGTMCQGHKIMGLEVLERKEEYDQVLIATNLYVNEIYSALRKVVDADKLILL